MEIIDKEFGTITVRRLARSKSMRATVGTNGKLRISVPAWTVSFAIRQMINSSRSELRSLLQSASKLVVSDGMTIGKRHTLCIRYGSHVEVHRSNYTIILTVTSDSEIHSTEVRDIVRAQVLGALRREAKEHLPERIKRIAVTHNLNYSALRFSHASTRWGSCTSKKVISLNIGLMNLPFPLIDYVLIHELAHTVELNHSKSFWKLVETMDPEYSLHRKLIKAYSPGV